MLFELYMMKCVTAAKDRQQCKIHFFGFLYKDRHKVIYNTYPSSSFYSVIYATIAMISQEELSD